VFLPYLKELAMRHVTAGIVVLLMSFLLGACAWVSLNPEANSVRVGSADEVKGCVNKGRVHVSVKHTIAKRERDAEKVASELSILARNEAARMGVDTVVAETPVTEGRQTFGAYACVK
jgi:hypothetical protein